MHTSRSRRAFVATALLGSTLLLTLTGCTTGDANIRPDGGGVPQPSGIQGQATRGPLSPVTQQGQANTAPLEGAVITFVSREGSAPVQQTTDSQGNYKVKLSPGAYQVQGTAPRTGQSSLMPPAPQTVTVTTGQFVTVNLAYDTGIR